MAGGGAERRRECGAARRDVRHRRVRTPDRRRPAGAYGRPGAYWGRVTVPSGAGGRVTVPSGASRLEQGEVGAGVWTSGACTAGRGTAAAYGLGTALAGCLLSNDHGGGGRQLYSERRASCSHEALVCGLRPSGGARGDGKGRGARLLAGSLEAIRSAGVQDGDRLSSREITIARSVCRMRIDSPSTAETCDLRRSGRASTKQCIMHMSRRERESACSDAPERDARSGCQTAQSPLCTDAWRREWSERVHNRSCRTYL